MTRTHPETWIYPDASGLYCTAGDFWIDPHRPVPRAVITHGHSDHARAGHGAVLATPETLAIMALRLGAGAGAGEPLLYGQTVRMGDVRVSLAPAGHVLGSAQVVMEHQAARVVVSGDYKREADPTCEPFEPVTCDVFVTEATFALPVFRHGPASAEIGKLLASCALFPDRCHVVGAYGLGKAQRVIALLRAAGWDRPIYLHGALQAMCALYEDFGIPLGPLLPATINATKAGHGGLKGEIVLAPPSALADRWSRRLADPVTAFASGWMRVRARARQRGCELPLVISDHADWPALLATIAEVAAPEVWVTHGRDDALVHVLAQSGVRARALALIGREDEAE